ncbi:hypothetical protein GF323_04525 [Candidatus Woesearchaeota archaeon]|nr:hypothetical protein [Candidatus Woesearchaeota archaeon]
MPNKWPTLFLKLMYGIYTISMRISANLLLPQNYLNRTIISKTMKAIIRCDGRIDGKLIAKYSYKGLNIAERLVEFLRKNNIKDVILASDANQGFKGIKNIHVSEINSKMKHIIDLRYTYDSRKLEKMIRENKSFNEAILFKNEKICHIKNTGCLYERKEWNPLSKFYIEPWGERIGFWLRNTSISPNTVTFMNTLLAILSNVLLFLGYYGKLAFGIWIRIFHMLDIVDGQLARIKCQGTRFGKWIDGAGDRLVFVSWSISISILLYVESKRIFFLLAGLFLLAGYMMYNYLLYTSVAYFRNNRFDVKSKSKVKQNPIIKLFLSFSAVDIKYHLLTVAAILNGLDIFIIFYAFYFNLLWLMYFVFYLLKYLKEGDILET